MRSPPELVCGFSPEGRRREEGFYRSLDGNAEYEELLERDRLAEEQRIADLRRRCNADVHRCLESQAERPQLGRLRGGRRPANSPGGYRARTRSRCHFFYQLVKWVSHLEAEASVDHVGMERANAREQRALSHLWQVRGEVEDAGAGV